MNNSHMDHDMVNMQNDQPAMCPMIMVFHAGHCENILFKTWVARTVVEFVLSAIAIFCIAFGYEALKFLREYTLRHYNKKREDKLQLSNKAQQHCASSNEIGACASKPIIQLKVNSYREQIVGVSHLIQTFFNLIQVIISYFLMLFVMTYNVWLCLAVVLGLGIGFFCFGWIRNDLSDTECCQ